MGKKEADGLFFMFNDEEGVRLIFSSLFFHACSKRKKKALRGFLRTKHPIGGTRTNVRTNRKREYLPFGSCSFSYKMHLKMIEENMHFECSFLPHTRKCSTETRYSVFGGLRWCSRCAGCPRGGLRTYAIFSSARRFAARREDITGV
jgi:hypothetical protein